MEQQIPGACLESAPARNSPRRIARTLCVRGPQACTPAHRSACVHVPRAGLHVEEHACTRVVLTCTPKNMRDRKSTRLNSSHLVISYAVFCLKKKKKISQSKRTKMAAEKTDKTTWS